MTDLRLPGQLDTDAWTALHQLGRAMHVNEGDLRATLAAILLCARDTVPAATATGVNLLERGRFEPQAILGAAPPRLDALQKKVNDGPCIAASRDQTVVHLSDVRTDDRWPEFNELALSLGIYSMLCVPLWVDEQRLGSLSLYGEAPNGFTEHDVQIATLIATHAATALADAMRATNLRKAMANRDLIGQAKGILMERHRITADAAFELLSRASQRANRKLVEVAETLTTTGELP